MAARKGRSAGTVPVPAENPPAPAVQAKGGKKKAVVEKPLSEKPVNVKPFIDMEQELAALTAKLNTVTLEREQTAAMLKEKDIKLQQSEEERAKLQKDMAKIQKQKAKGPLPEMNAELASSLLKLVAKDDEAEATADGEVQEKKRDSRKPKRPLSAYQLWSQEMKSEQPKGQADTSKAQAEWKVLPEAQKKKYLVAHEANMAAYNQAMAAYETMLEEEKRKEAAMELLKTEKTHAELAKFAQHILVQESAEEEGVGESSRPASKKKDPEKPKQPISAYIYFSNEKRQAIAAKEGTKRSITEESAILSAEWNKIKDDEKARRKWDRLAIADRARYAAEMEAYKAKKDEEEAALKAESEKELKETMEKMAAKEARAAATAAAPVATAAPLLAPVASATAAEKGAKRGPSGYNLFASSISDQIRKAEPAITFGELSRRVGAAWKEVDSDAKAAWNAKAAASAPAAKALQPHDSADFGL